MEKREEGPTFPLGDAEKAAIRALRQSSRDPVTRLVLHTLDRALEALGSSV